MSGTESLFDKNYIDFDDEEIQLEDISSRIPDQGGGGGTPLVESMPHSVTSPSIFNTRSTTGLNCGPNQSTTSVASNWVLGVRHLSFASNTLNERMAERGKHFSYISHNSNVKKFKQKSSNCVQKRDNKLSFKYPMTDIQEDCAEDFDTYRSHQIKNNVIYNKRVINLMNEKAESHRSSDRQINTGLNSSKQKCLKSVSQPIPQKAIDVSNSDKKITKLSANRCGVQTLPKIDYPNDDNQINDTDCGKRTKNCDIKSNNCENKTVINSPQKAVNSDQIKTTQNLSTNYKRSVNLVTLSAEQELQRYKSQRFCETVSLITIIFGLILVTITPFLLIPIWVIPNPYSPMIRNFLWLSMLTTVLLMTLAALTGNIYWYYDDKSQKWKWFYHCGKGPKDHYWGTSLLRNQNILKPLAKKVRKNNITINV